MPGIYKKLLTGAGIAVATVKTMLAMHFPLKAYEYAVNGTHITKNQPVYIRSNHVKQSCKL